ncbi:ATP-binding protein [Lewinella cohaerens]|uniref:ATP-binding protein n=1 Tax=Lewinella cohaerens TaxID=70995 RepID=UPI00035CB1CE|nr:ATP-binding protein [Lewinella cohaerens]
MSTPVQATPTKRFFVNSLTRDIELKDAILDLLDNCIDGVVRSKDLKTLEGENVYKGFRADIVLDEQKFEIHDNCGGIPMKIAIEEAFKFGRTNPERDAQLETVGMYGIGMKRAVFKMGTHILVESQHKENRYTVEIPPEWLEDDNDWMLNLENLKLLGTSHEGTSIIVNNLHDEISDRFSQRRGFAKELRDEVGRIFALIIKKGFVVTVNDVEVSPVSFDLLQTDEIEDQKDGIETYQLKSEYNDVMIDIAIGFYRPLASIDEVEEENRLSRSAANAGITIICNDRIVLFRDKSHITGWGSKPVPSFHNQFLPIAGIVRFSSANSENLPLTTTKRGLNLSAKIYWYALEYIKEGVKKFTDFTNQWKGKESEVKSFFEKATYQDPIKMINENEEKVSWRAVPKGRFNEKRVNPSLPKPARRNTKVRITFYREKEEVKLVAEYIYGDSAANPSDIGDFAFEKQYELAKEEL